MSYDGLMISVSGVRGRVGEALTPEVVARFAAGFGAWALARGDARTVVVGRDSRVSGPMFHRAVLSALESVGATVIDVGMAPTPTIQLAVEHHHAAGGLAITASHNPIEWNALKFISSSGLFLDPAESAAMRATVDGEIPRVTWDLLGSVTVDGDALSRHLEAILALPFIDVERIRQRHFHVALDCCNGAGATIMPALFERLGCKVTAINLTTDGRFPRSPEPVAANLGELERALRPKVAATATSRSGPGGTSTSQLVSVSTGKPMAASNTTETNVYDGTARRPSGARGPCLTTPLPTRALLSTAPRWGKSMSPSACATWTPLLVARGTGA